jgi:hypothetical protein
MISRATKGFWKAYRELPANVKTNARKVYRLWMRDPWHPSLHFKKVHTTRPIYSVRVGDGWRAICTKCEDHYIWFWIGSHSDYDIILPQL